MHLAVCVLQQIRAGRMSHTIGTKIRKGIPVAVATWEWLKSVWMLLTGNGIREDGFRKESLRFP